MSTEIDGTTRTYQWTVDEAFAKEMSRTVIRSTWREPRTAAPVLALALVGGLFGWWFTETWVAALLYLPVVLATIHILRVRSLTKQIRRTMAVGTNIETTFTVDTFTVQHDGSSATYPYTRMQHLRDIGRGVTFHLGNARVRCSLPREVFPPEELARLQTQR